MNDPTPATPPAPDALGAWRAGMRSELIARRMALASEDRARADLAISLHLLHALPAEAGTLLGFCWPYRGEYDARRLMRSLRERGVANALPVIAARHQPLRFRPWKPGVPMQRGPLGIPAPSAGPEVVPDILLAPLVGFGRTGDRLGYGGGYFDRTLASLDPQPLAIGVGYELCAIPTSFPQSHDIPMDAIVTEAGVRMFLSGELVPVDAPRARSLLEQLRGERRAQARTARATISSLSPRLDLNLP